MATCRECGCTDEKACPEGCFWVEPDLCSKCEWPERVKKQNEEAEKNIEEADKQATG